MGKKALKRINFSLTPELRTEFEAHANQLDMSLTEFLRRAGRLAMRNSDSLKDPKSEEDEAAYKNALGASRWTCE